MWLVEREVSLSRGRRVARVFHLALLSLAVLLLPFCLDVYIRMDLGVGKLGTRELFVAVVIATGKSAKSATPEDRCVSWLLFHGYGSV